MLAWWLWECVMFAVVPWWMAWLLAMACVWIPFHRHFHSPVAVLPSQFQPPIDRQPSTGAENHVEDSALPRTSAFWEARMQAILESIIHTYVLVWWRPLTQLAVLKRNTNASPKADLDSLAARFMGNSPRSAAVDFAPDIAYWSRRRRPRAAFASSRVPSTLRATRFRVKAGQTMTLPHFDRCVRERLWQTVNMMIGRLQSLDRHLWVANVIPLLTRHIADYKKAALMLSQSGRRRMTWSDEVEMTLAALYAQPPRGLHPALSSLQPGSLSSALHSASLPFTGGKGAGGSFLGAAGPNTLAPPVLPHSAHHSRKNSFPSLPTLPVSTVELELDYLRGLVQVCMPYLVPATVHQFSVSSTLVREIVVCSILQPVMDILSDPDYWNQLLDTYLGSVIKEQKMVNKLRQALEKSYLDDLSGARHSDRVHLADTLGNLSVSALIDYSPLIGKTHNLLDAKRLRSRILLEILKTKTAIKELSESRAKSHANVVEDGLAKRLNRLLRDKDKLDKKIVDLGGAVPRQNQEGGSGVTILDGYEGNLLQALLVDPGISYFKEFMDRVSGGPIALQFYFTVGAIQDAILARYAAQKFIENQETILFNGDWIMSQLQTDPTFETTLSHDMEMVCQTFFAAPDPTLHAFLGESVILNVKEAFVKSTHSRELQDTVHLAMLVWLARDSMLQIVESTLLPQFKASEFYEMWMSDVSLAEVDSNRISSPTSEARSKTVPFMESVFPKRNDSKSSGISTPSLFFSSIADTISRSGASATGVMKSVFNRPNLSNPNLGVTKADKRHSMVARSVPVSPIQGMNGSGSLRDMEPIRDITIPVPSLNESRVDPPKSSCVEISSECLSQSSTAPVVLAPEPTATQKPKRGNEFLQAAGSTVSSIQKIFQTMLSEAANDDDVVDEDDETEDLGGEKSINDSEKTSSVTSPIGSMDLTSDELLLDSVGTIDIPRPGETHQTVLLDRLTSIKQHMESVQQQIKILELMMGDISKVSDPNKELNILEKMKSEYYQELGVMNAEKTQVELQLNDSVIVAGRTTITIPSWAMGEDTDRGRSSRSFVVYIIEVNAQHDGSPEHRSSGWIIAKRYSEFDILHRELKHKYPAQFSRPGWELPGKRLFHFSVSNPLRVVTDLGSERPALDKADQLFMDERRLALQMYLRNLAQDEVIARSMEFRQFLCTENSSLMLPNLSYRMSTTFGRALFSPSSIGSGMSMVKHWFSKMGKQTRQQKVEQSERPLMDIVSFQDSDRADPEDDVRAQSTVTYITSPSEAIEISAPRLIAVNGSNVVEANSSPTRLHVEIGEKIQESLQASIQESFKLESPAGMEGISSSPRTASAPKQSARHSSGRHVPITEAVCDLFLEIFELKERNNWLRKQAVIIILQQIFGGTVERRVQETIQYFCSEQMVNWYLDQIFETIKLYGERPAKSSQQTRSGSERERTKESAERKLMLLIPDILGPMVGRSNAKKGAERIFRVFQNRRLCQELSYRILDTVVVSLVPEVADWVEQRTGSRFQRIRK